MDDMFQDFYALENTNGYTAANILSGFWISEKKAFENLVTTKEQDAHEFFQFLAEDLHERNGDGKKPEIGSEHSCNCIIHQTFYGKMQTTTTCQNCNSSSNTVQSFLDLSVGLDSLAQRRGKKVGQKTHSLTLTACLDEEYIKSDKCEYRCHHCASTQQARRYTSVKRLPNVLSIQLKVTTLQIYELDRKGLNCQTLAIRVQARAPRSCRLQGRRASRLSSAAEHATIHKSGA